MTEYAFIITLQYPSPDGFGSATSSFSGMFKTSPGMTRQTALADIMAEAKKQFGVGPDAPVNIMFFSFEPNQLSGA